MADWESKFREWAKPPSEAEQARCNNTISAIRAAINQSPSLSARSITAFVQGSYRNNTNVRRDSDVDVGILCRDTFFYKLPDNTTAEYFNIQPATYLYKEFKDDVGSALRRYFGDAAVTRGNKAFDIKAGQTHIEADVAPFFEHRRYDLDGSHTDGVELHPDNGNPPRIINFPEQHYENGVAKNNRTGRRFKALVRIIKSLRNEMYDGGVASTMPIIGFLSECLGWNVPDNLMMHQAYADDVREALAFLYIGMQEGGASGEWGEVSELKYLFRSSQRWTREQAVAFVVDAWNHVGFN